VELMDWPAARLALQLLAEERVGVLVREAAERDRLAWERLVGGSE
jgi:hypothetical protein